MSDFKESIIGQTADVYETYEHKDAKFTGEIIGTGTDSIFVMEKNGKVNTVYPSLCKIHNKQ